MDVPPHPHTGLQTVSWLFSGEVEHRDSAGVHAMVRPGELNLMTAGAGICHSEVSTADTTVLHGVQLWVALPDADRDTARDFAHYAPPVARARRRTGAGVPRRTRGRPVAGAHLHPAARRAGRPRPGAPSTLDIDRDLRTRRAARPGRRRGLRRRARGRRPLVPGAGPRPARSWPTAATDRRGCCCSAAPVRRAAGHVVELRRPQPRRHRRLTASSGRTHDDRFGAVDRLPRRHALPAPPLPNAHPAAPAATRRSEEYR